MSVSLVQDMVSDGKLENALSYLSENYPILHFERELYGSIIYLIKGDFTTALNKAIKAYDFTKSTSDNLNHLCAHVAIGYALLKLGKLDEANYYIVLAEKRFSDLVHKSNDIYFYWYRTLYQVKGGIKARYGDIEGSIQAFEKCLELSLMMNKIGLVPGIYNITVIYPNTQNYSESQLQYNVTVVDTTAPNITDRKSTRLNSSHTDISRMPSSA